MPKKSVFFSVMFCIVLLLCSAVSAQEQEYKQYTVQKGDTLWDISNKELNDPFLWPKVWKENPQIANPDRIYPGQKIRIPLYLLQKEVAPPEIEPEVKPLAEPILPKEEPVRIEPKKIKYLVPKSFLISSGYIADSVHSLGTITDSPGGETIFGKWGYFFVKMKAPVRKGDKYYIIRPIEKVKHPVTGKFVGHLIDVVGIAEVVDEADPKILITDSYWEVETGDLLDTFYEMEPPLAIDHPRKPDISGYVVASKHSHIISVEYDVAYIDKGRKDGLQIGDVFETLIQSDHRVENGIVQVINLREKTATVVVRNSRQEIEKGDPLVPAK
ncbi:MAG: LysM peptidoglycan-binding domain-containing protein [Nitrospirota bacterium]